MYKSLVRKLVADISEIKSHERMYKFQIELTKHEISKLKEFSSSDRDKDALRLIIDTTDILKSAHLETLDNEEILDNKMIYFGSMVLISYFLVLKLRFPTLVSFKKIVMITFVLLFAISAINNHIFLNQVINLKAITCMTKHQVS